MPTVNNIDEIPVKNRLDELDHTEVNVMVQEIKSNRSRTSQSVSFIAGQSLSAGRAVVREDGKIYYFNPSNVNHAGRAIGITKTSGTLNGIVEVYISGFIEDVAFSFQPDKPVFISSNGLLTTEPVLTFAVLQKAGVSLTSTRMIIGFELPLIRNL